jgi:hypothetical protein
MEGEFIGESSYSGSRRLTGIRCSARTAWCPRTRFVTLFEFGFPRSKASAYCKLQYKLLSGEAKRWTRKGDTGMDVTNVYCSTCHNLMAVEAEFMPDVKIIKTGTLDDKELLDKLPVLQEVYTRNRPDCFEAFKDAGQKRGQTE